MLHFISFQIFIAGAVQDCNPLGFDNV